MNNYKETLLWKKTLGKNEIKQTEKEQIELLRTSYDKMRSNVEFLVSKISASLPGLTQHEISHLDGLWDTASILIGETYEINPLEGFILGASILLHDSALSYEAYENGMSGLRDTIEWKDSYQDLISENELRQENKSKEEIEKEADFETLRILHANRAKELINKSWQAPSTKDQIFLLDDVNLRTHLGKLIGEIAASHHWNIEKVAFEFNAQVNAPSNFPREWRIDPLKIACILRCADAIHIDNRRAPDFLHALLKRNGISFDHWNAQNRLGHVDIYSNDPKNETLVFTSTIDFEETDYNSWFIAYDAICIASKEIRSSNKILEGKNSNSSFKIKAIEGINSPSEMSKFIKTKNWTPCAAQVHASNIENLVKNLGGEMLYGSGSDLFGIVIRELIQNSRDAIKARKIFDVDFVGKITLKISEDEETTILTIEDNGIGMSERVLTGPLLDFGTSFWASNLVKSEFPGLRSSEFKSIGKFGIGFYSIFMISKKVIVYSRNWDKGLEKIKSLKFPNGFTLRPILANEKSASFGSQISTQIICKLNENYIDENEEIEIKANRVGQENFKVHISDYIRSIVAGLDVDVYLQTPKFNLTKIHRDITSSDLNIENWLNDISFSKYLIHLNNIEYISRNVDRVKPIIENDQVMGLAAISTRSLNSHDFLGSKTIGGLIHSSHNRSGDDFIGFVNFTEKSAKRDFNKISASKQAIEDWGKEQMKLLQTKTLNPIEKFYAASSFNFFGIDPYEILELHLMINGQIKILTLEEIANLSLTLPISFFVSGLSKNGHIETHIGRIQIEKTATYVPIKNCKLLSFKIENGAPKNDLGLIDCVHRKIIELGYCPTYELKENITKNILNIDVNCLFLTSKEKIKKPPHS
ncbi:Histidine kinase-, DNA gyrase B-, and HSP90-like ATPase [Algoriphagus alkaliphilus]|uniref:Histidine kinase-, DNA gyrase B-, and HSP90-like ATPase n=1 Tax=Algoriphagus alkaliphilus TaxID=279824 RepID=A0A1G5WSQ6_9BACT|nr:ATP-binding protein [Algoriphagus alkaliphilus]SDA61218.1 Histidine kinase-, DNA gyrase B-, and HSP90-like ATPase [Algoriphagus alkaliphilus]